MTVPYLEAHVPDPDYEDRGDYEKVICTIRNIQPGGNAVDIHHSLFEGDRMTFHQIITSRDPELDWMRPIRFYNKDDVKLFDGIIINTKYTYIGSDYMALKVEAAGWWRELARMEFHRPQVYGAAHSVNDIYTDLVRIANDMGVMKEAVYKYDTTKIPEYGTYDTHYIAATGTEFSFNSVYEGMQTLTSYLDAVTPCDNLCPEFGLRIEALPRENTGDEAGITQNEAETAIYILPMPITSYKVANTTFKRFQLVASNKTSQGYTVKRDYKQLANNCVAIGDGIATQQYRTAKPLDRVLLTSNDADKSYDNQVLGSHYLRVTIENPTGSDKAGWVRVTRVDSGTNPIEKFAMQVSACETQVHYTSELTDDGLIWSNCFNFVYFDGCYVTVEEVTNDNSFWFTTIAGKSINDYGYAGKTIEAMWLNHTNSATAQAMVDRIAGKHCRLYHAPTSNLYAPVMNKHISYDNLIGCTAEFYSPYDADLDKFLITDAMYGFRGTLVTQRIAGMKYEYDWDYDDV